MGSAVSHGLLRPFRRDRKNDFAHGVGIELYQSRVGQILGTRASSEKSQGELRWRPAFGSKLYLLRHKRLTFMTRELGRFYAQDALSRWDKRCVVTAALVDRVSSGPMARALVVRIFFSVVDRRTGRVLARGAASASIPE